MPVRSAGKNPIASLSYDASVVESETRMPGSENFLELACRVVTLRLERGYLVKIYDVSSAELTKPLRRQLRENYDVKKVRNTDYGISLSLISNLSFGAFDLRSLHHAFAAWRASTGAEISIRSASCPLKLQSIVKLISPFDKR